MLVLVLLASLTILSVRRAEGFGDARIGEYCLFPDGSEGSCRPLQDCEAVIDMILSLIEPIICGFGYDEPLFCCIEGRGYQREEITSKIKCEEYENYCHDYGAKSIIGGVNASPREFKHMAALGYGSEYSKMWFCGGSLISEKFVLTAAHCLYSRSHGTVRWIRLGDLDLQSTTDDASPQEFTVKRTIYHPHYHPPSTYHDIGLIEINGLVKFTEYVCPACLHHQEDPIGNIIYATGWGIVNSKRQWGNHLQAVPLPLANVDDCLRIYPSSRRLVNGLMETQLCVGGGHDMKDTCEGDSGGPLQFEAFSRNGKKRYIILAITSFGKQCGTAGSPSVYTRIAPYVSWIESVVWSH